MNNEEIISLVQKQQADLEKALEIANNAVEEYRDIVKKLNNTIDERDAALVAKDKAINLMVEAMTKVIFKDLTEFDKEIIRDYKPGDSYSDTAKRSIKTKSKVGQTWKKFFKHPTQEDQTLLQELLGACKII